ncbi:MAG: DUF1281 family ferredoxin-like fold protein [Mucilaginibacter sp.]
MTNYVSNSVQFIGAPAKVAEVRELFLQIEAKQQASNLYHLPDFVTGDHGHMTEIETDGDWLRYITESVPNLKALLEIARHYELDFAAEYEETNEGLYGEAVFTNNQLRVANLNLHWETMAEQKALADLREMRDHILKSHLVKR